MAFPIIPRKRSGATGNPSSLTVGELAVNTATGELFLGGDSAVLLLNPPTAAGTTATERTGDGTTTAFTFSGYNGTDDGGYLVSVGGIDQPPSTYAVSATAGGTITFIEAPTNGELISIRAIVAGASGGGGSGIGGRAWSATETYAEGDLVATAQRETWICIQNANINHDPTTSPLWWQPMPADAVSLQLVPVATTSPSNGQVLAYSSATGKWQPTSLNATVGFNTPGTHTWAVPAWARWVYVNGTASNGTNGTATSGTDGAVGITASFDSEGNATYATSGANGTDGTASAGSAGKSISISALSFLLAAGAAGQIGVPGYGGGGSGGGGCYDPTFGVLSAAAGSDASYLVAGSGKGGGAGTQVNTGGTGGASGGGDATAGGDGSLGTGGAAGTGAINGGNGGVGGVPSYSGGSGGGGGGGGNNFAGGGGGGGGGVTTSGSGITFGFPGAPGKGGTADTSMCAGGTGETFVGPLDLSSVAGTIISIVISEGEGTASISFTY